MTKEFTVDVPVRITDETIDDILVTSLEGGSNYWCNSVEVIGKYLGEYASDQISRGGKLKFIYNETDDEDEPEWAEEVLTLNKFYKGLQLFLQQHPECIVDGEVDSSMIDGMYADMIIQYALFSELVYG